MRIVRTGMLVVAAAGGLAAALGAAVLAWGGAPGASAAPLGSPPAAPMLATAGVVSGTVRVTNVRDHGFAVSWLTTSEVTGAVRYGQSPNSLTAVAPDDIAVAGRTHHVTLGADELSALSADTLYYYDILSTGGVDDNGGAHYLYATGPTLLPPGPGESAYGQVVTATSAALPYSIVYWWLQDYDGLGSMGLSDAKSVIADSGGWWNFSPGDARQGDLSGLFDYVANTDHIELAVQGSPDGRATDSFVVSAGANRTVTVAAGTQAPPAAPAPVPSPTPAPDLVVTGIAASPAGPGPGCPVTLTVSIRNQGNASALAPFRVALYLDHSRVPYPGERSNTNTYWVITQTLAPSGTLSLSAKTPAVAPGAITALMAPGTHTLYAQVDSYNNLVGETSEANNLWGPLAVNTSGTCYHVYLPLVVRSF